MLVFASEAARERHGHPGARNLVVEARSKLLWDQVAVPLALRRERVDVVLGAKHSIPLAPVAPRVFMLHGADWIAFPENYYAVDRLYHRVALPLYLKSAERVITISHDSARRILDLHAGGGAQALGRAPRRGGGLRAGRSTRRGAPPCGRGTGCRSGSCSTSVRSTRRRTWAASCAPWRCCATASPTRWSWPAGRASRPSATCGWSSGSASATGSGSPAGSRTRSSRSSTRWRTRSCSRRSTRASASRCSRPWPAAARS